MYREVLIYQGAPAGLLEGDKYNLYDVEFVVTAQGHLLAQVTEEEAAKLYYDVENLWFQGELPDEIINQDLEEQEAFNKEAEKISQELLEQQQLNNSQNPQLEMIKLAASEAAKAAVLEVLASQKTES